MPRLQRNRSRASQGGITLYADQDRPVHLRLDTQRKGFSIATRWISAAPNARTSLQSWAWQNGPGGAGTTIETLQSAAAGSSEYAEFGWLRRKGVAQPSGALTELTLPPGIAAYGSSRPWRGRTYGVNNDLYLTTISRYILVVANGTGTGPISETDFGATAATVGVAVFDGAGTACLYVGTYASVIWEFNGAVWTAGEANTLRGELETVYWTIGDALATGGAAGSAGGGGHRLVGTNNAQYGFYHVAGDPKVAANWSALTKVGVGGSVYPITRTISSNRVVWFVTGLGVLGADELGNTPNYAKFMELSSTHSRLVVAEYWAGLIWLATPLGLAAFSPDGSRVDFGTFLQFGAKAGTTPIYGLPRCLAATPDGMMVGYYNAETETSYWGCLVRDDDGSFRWSMAEGVIVGEEITYLQLVVGSDDVPRLFVGTIDAGSTNGLGTMHLYTQSLPKSGDPETDFLHGGPFVAAENWSLRLSRFSQDGIPMSFRRWIVEADQIGDDYPSNTLELQTSLDGGDFVVQGTATASPRWSGAPRAGYVNASSAQVKLQMHNDGTLPIVVRSVSANYALRPDRTKVITYPVLIAEGPTTGGDPGVTLTRLERSQRDAAPLTATDHFGRAVEWVIEDVTEETTEMAAGNGWQVHATISISQTRQPSRFDVDAFDVGAPFS